MNNNISLSFIKGQLEAIKQAESLDFAKGLAQGLSSYVDAALPISISILKRTNNNLIESIKHIRQVTGLGLAEAKGLAESKGLVYSGHELDKALRLVKALETHFELDIQGPENFKLFFTKG